MAPKNTWKNIVRLLKTFANKNSFKLNSFKIRMDSFLGNCNIRKLIREYLQYIRE